jgi:hypothetical protein
VVSGAREYSASVRKSVQEVAFASARRLELWSRFQVPAFRYSAADLDETIPLSPSAGDTADAVPFLCLI